MKKLTNLRDWIEKAQKALEEWEPGINKEIVALSLSAEGINPVSTEEWFEGKRPTHIRYYSSLEEAQNDTRPLDTKRALYSLIIWFEEAIALIIASPSEGIRWKEFIPRNPTLFLADFDFWFDWI